MEVDRLSNLPDELLCRILSSLPTKLAFTTTILSKRWTSLFDSLSVFRFEFNTSSALRLEDSASFNRFRRFVDNLILSTNKPIETFHLDCRFVRCKDQDSNTIIIKSWLEATIRRRIQQLHLNLFFTQLLNPNFLNSDTLTYLKLQDVKMAATDTSCVHLPSLKTLHLDRVIFTNQNDYINFLSACSNLEDLHDKRIPNRMNHDEIENNTPEEEEEEEFTLSNLVSASIDSMDVMFNVFKNVKFLRVITSYMEEDSFNGIPLFQNLIHIELVFAFYRSFYSWDIVVNLLRHCPKIQILYIEKWTTTSRISKKWEYPISVIECVSMHLKSCTILNFQGSANDLRFAKYILQNASLLQDMKIGVATRGMPLLETHIRKELSSSSRFWIFFHLDGFYRGVMIGSKLEI